MSKQISTKTTIRNLTAEIKKTFVKKDAFTPVQTAANAAIKSLGVDGNTVNFYTSTDKSGTAAFSVDFPSELFLDQTKTTFVAKFKFDAATYLGATDPKLDGKPVMVLAVKGENPENVTYSFLNMAALVDTYTAKTDGKDASTTIEIAGYEVEVKVNIFRNHGSRLCLNSSAPQSLRKALFSSFLVMRVNSRKHAVEVNHAAAVRATAATMEAVILSSGEIDAEVNRLLLVSANTVGTQDFYFSSA